MYPDVTHSPVSRARALGCSELISCRFHQKDQNSLKPLWNELWICLQGFECFSQCVGIQTEVRMWLDLLEGAAEKPVQTHWRHAKYTVKGHKQTWKRQIVSSPCLQHDAPTCCAWSGSVATASHCFSLCWRLQQQQWVKQVQQALHVFVLNLCLPCTHTLVGPVLTTSVIVSEFLTHCTNSRGVMSLWVWGNVWSGSPRWDYEEQTVHTVACDTV